MSTVMSNEQCPQCGYRDAWYQYNCWSAEEILCCVKRITTDRRVNAEASYITRWDAEAGQVVAVYGQLPPAESAHGEETTGAMDLNPDSELVDDFCPLPDVITI